MSFDPSVFLNEYGEIEDPCGLARLLYAAEIRLAAGETAAKIEFRDRTLWLQPGNIDALKALRTEAQRLCSEQTGRPMQSRRFAATAGYHRGSRRDGGGGFTGGFNV